MYQIQLKDECLKIINVGNCSKIPDIIISKDFGINNEFSLYSCVYSDIELNNIINNDCGFIQLIKLIKSNDVMNMSFSIAIKINKKSSLQFNVKNFEQYTDFNVYFLWSLSNKTYNNFFVDKLEKNINCENIIDILFENTINKNILIYN